MHGFVTDIEKQTVANQTFRTVLYTGKHLQLVLMRLSPREEIGEEVHTENDQFFRFETGTGRVVIDGVSHDVSDGTAVVVPAGARHNIINTSDTDSLTMYTIYGPSHHKDGTVHATPEDAKSDDEEFDGVTTE